MPVLLSHNLQNRCRQERLKSHLYGGPSGFSFGLSSRSSTFCNGLSPQYGSLLTVWRIVHSVWSPKDRLSKSSVHSTPLVSTHHQTFGVNRYSQGLLRGQLDIDVLIHLNAFFCILSHVTMMFLLTLFSCVPSSVRSWIVVLRSFLLRFRLLSVPPAIPQPSPSHPHASPMLAPRDNDELLTDALGLASPGCDKVQQVRGWNQRERNQTGTNRHKQKM